MNIGGVQDKAQCDQHGTVTKIVWAIHVKISLELAHNKAERLIKAHCLPLEISLKQLLNTPTSENLTKNMKNIANFPT